MKERINEIRKGFFEKKHFAVRLIAVMVAVILMGFSISWVILADLGTDPCSLMNIAISKTLGMTLGNWQALLNIILLVVGVICGAGNLGFGTIANMFLVGYSVDFFSWIWRKVLPEGLFDFWGVRIAVVIPALVLFVLAAAVYIDMDIGTAPYDAIPIIISRRLPNLPFRGIRIAFDSVVTVIGILFGGKPGIVTILVVLTLGPVISWVSGMINKKWNFFDI